MIEVILKRAWEDHRATLGMLTIKGIQHDPFWTLENPKRDTTIDCRIPYGFYHCVPHSGLKYKNVYLVKDVPNRTDILFHSGNYERETLGCILLGSGACTFMGDPMVTESREAMKRFRSLIGDTVFDLNIV